MHTPLFNSPLRTATLYLFVIGSFAACKKDGGGEQNNSLKALLATYPDKVWQLERGQDSDYWQNDHPWHHYNFAQGTALLFSPCVLQSSYFGLLGDGSYEESVYTCDFFAPTGEILPRQNGNTGNWSMEKDNETLTLNGQIYKLVSVTPAGLIISNGGVGTLYYKSVAARPFNSRNEQIAGIAGKTYKYTKLEYNYNLAGDPLTTKQLATRLTYKPDNTLTVTYTDTSLGHPVTGTWALKQLTNYGAGEVNVYAIVNTLPASAGVLLENVEQTVVELTDQSIIVSYTDGSMNSTKVYMVPE